MKIILLTTLLLLFWAGIYWWLRGRALAGGQAKYNQWILSSLADMFYTVDEKLVFRALVALAVTGAVVGFFTPGKVSQVDQKRTIEQAVKHNQQGEFDQAALILEEIENVDSPLLHNELGVAYLGLGNFDRAEKALMKAATLLPHYGKAHQNLATLYLTMGRFKDADFEASRAREAENYDIPSDRIYNLSDNLMDQLGIRIFLAALLALGGYQLPRLIILYLRHRRRKKFDEQLADGLVMIANGLRAGLSLVQAIEMVVKEGKPPLSQEFEMVLREHHLGSSLGDALKHLAERMTGTDTKIMVNATLILLESGGNLPERFDSLAQTIQERKRLQLKIKSMTAEGETQAWILALLPLVLGVILNTMNHEVFSLMYTTVLGWIILILIFLMEAVGLFWMLKIVKVKI
ncbi:MAG: type II secretion system F family protein [Desulfosalsimonadaceae bacterium]